MEDSLEQVTAVVLAGADRRDALARAAGVSSKAFVPIAGKPMAGYVLKALQGSAAVDQVVYVGTGANALAGASQLTSVPGGGSFVQSLALGLGAAFARAPAAPALIVTVDVPWLTPAAVDRFVTAATGAELAYPIVPEEAALAAFPSQKRTYVRLKQGRFTGGNLMLLRDSLVGPLLDLIDSLYRARKNPVLLAGLVGPRTLLELALGNADLARLESVASARLGGKVRAVVSRDACLAADIDRSDQLFPGSLGAES